MLPFSLNIDGRPVLFTEPAVMAILNVTDDSFHAPSRVVGADAIARRAEAFAGAGARFIDIGACSTRPGAACVDADEELRRVETAVAAVRNAVGADIIISVDTFRAAVARRAVEAGAHMVNDVSSGALDPEMFSTVAELRVPYVLMHMRGTPQTMQSLTDYSQWGGDVTAGVVAELSEPLARLRQAGVADVIVDPGFGFAKTLEQNYSLMRNLECLDVLGAPLLVGISRKSMLTKLLDISTSDALPATTALNLFALAKGAAILRVHDPAEALQALRLNAALALKK